MKLLKDNPMNNTSKNNTIFTFSHVSYKGLLEHMQKITRAIYMIVALVEGEDYVINSLKKDTIDTTKLFSSLLSVNVLDESSLLSRIHGNLFHIHSCLDILSDAGAISEMNHHVVSSEIKKINTYVVGLLHERSPKNKISSDLENFFLQETETYQDNKNLSDTSAVQSPMIESPAFVPLLVRDHAEKKNISPTNNLEKKPLLQSKPKFVENKNSISSSPSALSLKEKRQENIINILKQKKDASIKDICTLFKDCSSKTIQRDLAELIDMKKVVKRGDRRWSQYNLAK